MTPKQKDILGALLAKQGQPVSRTELYEAMNLPEKHPVQSRSLDVQIGNIRKAGYIINHVRGFGYQLEAKDAR